MKRTIMETGIYPLQLGDNFRIAYDGVQWIIAKRHAGAKSARHEWENIGYVASSKRIVMRILREHYADVIAQNIADDSLPDVCPRTG